MKKIFFLLLTVFSLQQNIQAQDFFLSLREKAVAAINNPNTAPLLKEMNQFKLDALDYMVIKMKEEKPDSSVVFLDKQAYALNNFLLFYIQSIIDSQSLPKVYQVKVIKLFMDASYSNPLFDDKDRELTLSYYNNGKSMTRFSLDTNWQIAYIAASTELKKIK